ncbi:SPOR domain-containing protein [Vibrio sp. AND4]|uniref:SPOR domain-containing protein n=1 Tax=Vibrio sp. AND4 TaxID=314289 RepID=UPI00015F06A7|nr:SPOR domain-containing protein [Vibrio sp. AND4]EDP57509.1 ATP-dependent protease peptidase subunit [Vibrio sp. AND4]
MANRDYVRRGRGAPKKSTKKQSSRKKPWRSGLLAILLAGGFGYGLYLLNSDPEPKQTVVKQQPVTTSKPKPKQDIPPLPEEKWEYVESLPQREVEVVAKDIQVSKVPYVMQCGAYKNQSQADERKLAIAFQGMSSRVIKKPGSSWYRIVLGPYKFKREAEKDRHKLQRAKIEPCAIWKENL